MIKDQKDHFQHILDVQGRKIQFMTSAQPPKKKGGQERQKFKKAADKVMEQNKEAKNKSKDKDKEEKEEKKTPAEKDQEQPQNTDSTQNTLQ